MYYYYTGKVSNIHVCTIIILVRLAMYYYYTGKVSNIYVCTIIILVRLVICMYVLLLYW